MRFLDAHLSGNGPYVTGAAFTLADIPVGLTVNRWFMITASTAQTCLHSPPITTS